MEDKETTFYIYVDGTRHGPLSRDTVLENIKEGRVKPGDYIWDEVKGQWIKFADCYVFSGDFRAKTECEDPNADGRLIVCPKCKVVNKNYAVYCKGCGSGLEGGMNNSLEELGPSVAKEELENELSTNVGKGSCRETLVRSAREGNREAQFQLGVMYYEGNGVEVDFEKAVFWFSKAAERGDIEAQHVLGVIYTEGKGVTQDFMEAVNWYRKAAEKGYAPAQNNLGVAYEKGRGVFTNYREAFNWYYKAAVQNYSLAQYNLGLCYVEGQGVGNDAVKAYMWFSLAAAQGYEGSAEARDELVQIMSARQIAEGQGRAREWLVAFHKGERFINGSEEGISPPEPSWFYNTLSFFIPVIGVILGVVYLGKDNAACKESGRLFLLAGIGGGVLYFLCFACGLAATLK